MDKEYLKKHGLMNAHNQFMHLSEGYLTTTLAEDGDDENMPQQDEPQEPNNMGQGDMPQGEMPQDAPNMGQGGDAQQEVPMTEIPTTPAPEAIEDVDNEINADADEDVIDVEDLTQAQEKLNKKQNKIGHELGDVDSRISSLLTAMEKIQGSLEKNNQDIINLKGELEKRVPTEKEKLNMQSLRMYPYNVSPNDYWKEKEGEGRYEAEDKKKEYKVTQDDVDNYNEREVEDSFDEKLHQTMKDIFSGF